MTTMTTTTRQTADYAVSVRVGFDILRNGPSEMFASVKLGRLELRECKGHGYTLAKLKREVRDDATAMILEANDQREHWERTIIGCGDGSVVLVSRRRGTWQVDRAGPNIPRGGSTISSWNTFEDARAYALEQYAEFFGGIIWESRI